MPCRCIGRPSRYGGTRHAHETRQSRNGLAEASIRKHVDCQQVTWKEEGRRKKGSYVLVPSRAASTPGCMGAWCCKALQLESEKQPQNPGTLGRWWDDVTNAFLFLFVDRQLQVQDIPLKMPFIIHCIAVFSLTRFIYYNFNLKTFTSS